MSLIVPSCYQVHNDVHIPVHISRNTGLCTWGGECVHHLATGLVAVMCFVLVWSTLNIHCFSLPGVAAFALGKRGEKLLK